MKNRLFYKIFGSYLIVAALTLATVGFIVLGKANRDTTQKVEENLLAHARIIALLPAGDIARNIADLGRQSHSRVTFIDPTGRVLADSEHDPATMDNHLDRAEIQEARIKGRGSATRFSHTLDVDMLYVALPMQMGQKQGGYIRLARPLYEIVHATDRLYQATYEALSVIIIPLLLIAFIYTRRIIKPVRKIEAFTRRIARGDLAGSLILPSSDEIGDLAQTINYMAGQQRDRLREAMEERGKLEAAFSSMSEGVLILDGENRVEFINAGMREIIKGHFTVHPGQTPLEAFRNASLQTTLDLVRQTGQAARQEITLGGESPLTLDVTISPIQAQAGDRAKIMMVFHDVTRLKNLERMRVDFVANVTHEIKTPLTAITGFVETILAEGLEDREATARFLRIIDDNAQRLNRLVDDLLTLSHIELGETKLSLETVSLEAAVGDAVTVMESRAKEKGIVIGREPSETALPPVKADRDKVMQVLLNVLDNAVKFTPSEGVVRAGVAAPEGSPYVVVRIDDTGVGIPKSELPRIGERFYRVDKVRSRQLGGTGLGLSIVRHLMKLHHGHMEIESTPGKGTSVSLSFPLDPSATPLS
jgi:two-component system, OmpR family, phosphate regulon sensor histidine kinase PhoR